MATELILTDIAALVGISGEMCEGSNCDGAESNIRSSVKYAECDRQRYCLSPRRYCPVREVWSPSVWLNCAICKNSYGTLFHGQDTSTSAFHFMKVSSQVNQMIEGRVLFE